MIQPWHQLRMSKHFTLLDFMQDHLCYTCARPLAIHDLLNMAAFEAGRTLARDLLEPVVERYGPISIASGWRPEAVLDKPDFQTPHRWGQEPPLGQSGAAADIVVHERVNAAQAPITWLQEAVRDGFDFNRAITYAGSEFVCVSTSSRPRRSIYENIRVLGRRKPEFKTHARNFDAMRRFGEADPVVRKDWRRAEGEGSYHHKGDLRAQHVRVGRYFTLLDFCRSERAMAGGICWVPPLWAEQQITRARMFAEVLDPLKKEVGHISVVRGMEPRKVAEEGHRWTADEQAHRIEFLLPEGASHRRAAQFIDHEAIQKVCSERTSVGTHVSIRINPSR